VEGTRAGRLEEFPEADLHLDRPLTPDADGRYAVPRSADGRGCLGLKWSRQRRLQRLELDLYAGDVEALAGGIELQGWVNDLGSEWGSDSDFQGRWEPLAGTRQTDGRRLCFEIAPAAGEVGSGRALRKVRWVFPSDAAAALAVGDLAAYTLSSWASDTFLFEMTGGVDAGETGEAVLENGEIVVGPDTPAVHRCEWNLAEPLLLEIRYCKPRTYDRSDRTAIRLTLPTGIVTIAVDDLLTHPAVYLSDFRLFATRKASGLTAQEYAAQTAGRLTVLEGVELEPDQDFAGALRAVHLTAHDERPMVVSLACSNHKIEVRKDGSLQFDSTPDAAERADRATIESGYYLDYRYGMTPRFGQGPEPTVSRRLIGEWMPIPESVFRDGQVLYRQRTFVAPVDGSPMDSPPLARIGRGLGVVEYEIENHRLEPADGLIQLTFLADRSRKQQVPAELKRVPEGVLAFQQDELIAFVDLRGADGMGARLENGTVTLSAVLAAQGRRGFHVYLPLRTLSPGDYADLEISTGLLERTQAHWHHVMSGAMTVEIPDRMMENVIRAAQVHCLIAARNEDDGQRIAPWIGQFLYGPLDSEAQAIIRGMQSMGHEAFARKSLEFFLARFRPEGYMTHGYTLLGTGQHLWTLAEFFELYRDSHWFEQAAMGKMGMACDWIVQQRAKTLGLEDANGVRRPEAGLLPPGAVADQPAFVYSFFANGTYWAGLERAVALLREMGDERAGRWIAAVEAYRDSIVDALAWMQSRVPVVPLRDGNWVPPCAGHVYGSEPGIYYGRNEALVELAPQVLAAQGVLSPGSRRTRWIMDYLEDMHYIPAHPDSGLADLSASRNPDLYDRHDWFGVGGFSKFQPYYGRTAEVYALMDAVKPFIRTYFNTVASCLNTEALYQTENPWVATAYAKTHETGYFLYQTRLMYVMERDDTLWLAPFVPSHWLEDGRRVRIGHAPTAFGEVSYEIRSRIDSGRIDARIDVPVRRRPEALVLRLRHPAGKRVVGVRVNGSDHTGFDADRNTVTLPCDHDRLDVQVLY
jgi:hypothetical protein